MDLHKLFLEVLPGRIYSVSEAARYLGVHRCTVYAYISHPERPLPFVKMQDKTKLMFRGADLIAYKAAGLPKKGSHFQKNPRYLEPKVDKSRYTIYFFF